MKGGFDELKVLDASEVYAKTHVSQTVFNNIVNKRFDKLKSVQTKGQITVLENAYNLDLSDWLNEYNEYLNTTQPKTQTLDKLAIESKEIKTKSFPKIWIITPLIILVIAFVIFSIKNSSSVDINETNLTSEANETNISLLLSAPLDTNLTSNLDINMTDSNQSQQVVAVQAKAPEANATAAPLGALKLEFTPKRKLWLGIYYLDEDNKSDFRDDLNTTVQLNSLRPQVIRMGPSFFTIKLGDTVVIDSNTEKPGRYLYDPKEKKIRSISQEEFETLRPSKKQQ